MRNPNRIQPILDRLRKLWEAHPELRLGQLIGNVFNYSSKPDIYYFEDEEFIDKLEASYPEENDGTKSEHYKI